MKIINLILFTLFISNFSFGQDFANKSISLVALNTFISNDVLDKLDSYTPTASREKAQYTKTKKLLNQHINDYIFDEVTAQLAADKNITHNGKDAVLDGRVTYNEYGYPLPFSAKGGVKKARKNGDTADAYFKVNTTIGAAMDILGGSKLSKQHKPEISVVIAFLGTDGKEIINAKSKFKASEQIKAKNFPEKKFDKLDDGYIELLVEELKPMLSESIKMAVAKL